MPAKPLKFVIVADAHIGTAKDGDVPTRFPERAKSLLRYVVSRSNADLKPDFFVQLGDLIESEDPEEDEDNLSSAVDVLRDLQTPLYHVLGNHEQQHLKLAQTSSILKQPKPYYSFNVGAFRFVVLAARKDGDNFVIDKEQILWLEQDLGAAEKPCIVFSHFALHDEELNDVPQEAEIALAPENRAAVRNALALSNKVRAVFSGHLHKNDLHEIGGICYVSIQSLVQNISDTRKVPSESFAVVKLFENETLVEVEGMDPMEFRF